MPDSNPHAKYSLIVHQSPFFIINYHPSPEIFPPCLSLQNSRTYKPIEVSLSQPKIALYSPISALSSDYSPNSKLNSI